MFEPKCCGQFRKPDPIGLVLFQARSGRNLRLRTLGQVLHLLRIASDERQSDDVIEQSERMGVDGEMHSLSRNAHHIELGGRQVIKLESAERTRRNRFDLARLDVVDLDVDA